MFSRVRIDGLPPAEDLGFAPQPMVRWLSPRGLAVTGVQLTLSGIFGAYADKREIQAALKRPSDVDLSSREELWLDFMGDTGDGFDPTYALARILARPTLDVRSDGDQITTRRGDVLLLGGDMAYPAASQAEYKNRFGGPFSAAFPDVNEGEDRPLLMAVAGNHDWLDGLTTFLRVFTDGGTIGGWQTAQSRSYFFARLPFNWSLMVIDLAFDYFIDTPQMQFFRQIATEELSPGDPVILALHRPYWIFGPLHAEPLLYSPAAMSNLQRFEKEIIHDNGLQLPLVLAGDIHHYNRYERTDGPHHRIVAGAGAAFLYPTHNLPASIEWPEVDGIATYGRRGVYPDAGTSRRLRWGTLLAPFKNPSFVAFIGAVYLFFALMIRFSVSAGTGRSFKRVVEGLGPDDILQVLLNFPGSFLLAVVLGSSLVVFADVHTWPRRVLIGGAHSLTHLVLIVTLVWAVAVVLPPFRPIIFAVVFAAVSLVAGGYLGSQLFAIYLFLMQLVGRKHPTHSFSCQHIEDHRSFLRIRFDPDGSLTIYPIGVRKVPRRWRYVKDRGPIEPWFEPVDAWGECHLIEDPIRIDPRP
jgi:Calcineurin-like phosphoesterase